MHEHLESSSSSLLEPQHLHLCPHQAYKRMNVTSIGLLPGPALDLLGLMHELGTSSQLVMHTSLACAARLQQFLSCQRASPGHAT